MATTYTSKYANGAAVDAALDKAGTSLQPGDVVNTLDSQAINKPLSAAQGKALADGKQPLNSDLTALAGLSTTGLIERTGAGAAVTVTVTAAGKALLDDANAAAQLATLGAAASADLAIETDNRVLADQQLAGGVAFASDLAGQAARTLASKQDKAANLTAIAALAVTDNNFIVGNGSTFVAESGATARSSLGLGDSATKSVGTTAGTIAAGDDSRLSNARTPVAHKTSHATGGSDALTAADIGAATAATEANLTTETDNRTLYDEELTRAVAYATDLAGQASRVLSGSVPSTVPASAAAPGRPGQIAFDASYIYVCTASGAWKRAALSTW